jgi:HEAT repeat protein
MELVRALSARSDPSAVPALFELAGEESSPARRAALQALGQLVDGSHLDASSCSS